MTSDWSSARSKRELLLDNLCQSLGDRLGLVGGLSLDHHPHQGLRARGS